MVNRFLVCLLFICSISVNLSAQETQRIDLKLEAPGNYRQQIAFVFGPDLSDNYESDYDAFAFSSSSVFSMSVPLNGNNWLIVAVETVAKDRIFPINVVTNQTRNYTLTVGSFSNFDGREKMYFVDSLKDQTYPLNPETNVTIEIKPSETTDRFFFYIEKEQPITWDGNAWSNTTGPSETDDVNFTGNYLLSSDADRTLLTGNDFMIESGVNVIIDNEGTLDLKGNLENAGQLTIESGAALLTYSGQTFTGNNILIKRNTRYGDGKYSFVGSPVEQNQDVTGADLGSIVYHYNEQIPYGDDQGLSRWEDASNVVLKPGMGYAQANQKELAFTGIPNSGTITYTGTYSEDVNDNLEGWNLVANPYASAIKLTDFLSGNANITGAVYIWDDGGSDTQRGSDADYIVANASGATNTTPARGQTRFNGHIGSTQGFFVKLLQNGDKTVSFTESMRTASNNEDDHFFRTTDVIERLRLNLTNEKGLFRQTLLARKDGVESERLNPLYDAVVFSTEQKNSLYSIKLNTNLAIQTIDKRVQELPLGLHVDEPGNYTLSIEKEGFGGEIFLLDLMKNEVAELSANGYGFYATSGQFQERFVLSFNNELLSTKLDNINVCAHHNSLHFQLPKNELPKSYVVRSLTGQKVRELTITESTSVDLSGLKAGAYILTYGSECFKFFID